MQDAHLHLERFVHNVKAFMVVERLAENDATAKVLFCTVRIISLGVASSMMALAACKPTTDVIQVRS